MKTSTVGSHNLEVLVNMHDDEECRGVETPLVCSVNRHLSGRTEGHDETVIEGTGNPLKRRRGLVETSSVYVCRCYPGHGRNDYHDQYVAPEVRHVSLCPSLQSVERGPVSRTS